MEGRGGRRTEPPAHPRDSTREGGDLLPAREAAREQLGEDRGVAADAVGARGALRGVALGTPVWTTFEGRLGAVDERLIAEGRLKKLDRPEDVEVRKRDAAERAAGADRVRRDPAVLAELLTGGLARE